MDVLLITIIEADPSRSGSSSFTGSTVRGGIHWSYIGERSTVNIVATVRAISIFVFIFINMFISNIKIISDILISS